jgi:SAM-dependent methyltransferase
VIDVAHSLYSDADAAALYDVLNPWGPDSAFYLPLLMDARAALDLGCGTGQLLHRARESGHSGRLCGVDPDAAMLARAQRRRDIEWLSGTASSVPFVGEFDLAVMTGHAFQCLVEDDELQESLRAIHRALTPDGLFAFETRNPERRAWEDWHGMSLEAKDPSGAHVRIAYDVEAVDRDVVTLTESTLDAAGVSLRVDRARLRFLDVAALDANLARAGFSVETRYGGWDREALSHDSTEIVTIARRSEDGAGVTA